MKDPGKKFETDFKNSMPSDAFCIRLKTRMTQYKGDGEIADYIVYRRPDLFVFELKSTKEKRLPFVMIRPNQIIGIRQAVRDYGIAGGFVVQFREPYSHWFVPISVLDEYISAGKKSIPIADMKSRKEIIEIPFTIKRITCILNVKDLLDKIKEEDNADNTTSSTGN